MRLVAAVLFALATLWLAPHAAAHARSASYSSWWLEAQGARARIRVTRLDASLLERAGLERRSLGEHLSRALTLSSTGGPCVAEPGSIRELGAPEGAIDFELRMRCPSPDGLTLTSQLLVDQNPTHLHFVRVFGPGEATTPAVEGVLDVRARTLPLTTRAAAPPTASTLRFLRLGVEHILSGWDHLVFLLMLVLAGGTLRRTALVVSGFTLGHSITLTLATLGTVVADVRPIEALIGLSIVVLALENVWLEHGRTSQALPRAAVAGIALLAVAAAALGRPGALAFAGMALFALSYFALLSRSERPETVRALVAAVFGLVHGFGFARALQEMQLPAVELGRALLGFNLGVELGQIALILLVWPLLRLAERRTERRAPLVTALAAAALGLGSYWLVVRALG